MKTAELTGAALDWAVAKCEGYKKDIDFDCDSGRLFLYRHAKGLFCYSTNWSQGGPIIERERISLVDVGIVNWKATTNKADMYVVTQYGDTPLIAAMRCYVASKFGDEVEIPEELA
jgi:hypothetical protein